MTRYQILIEQNGYDIKYIPDEDRVITADIAKLDQVIYNFINNAINYTGDNKVICQEILKAHGFAYGVQSEEGKGSTFWFEAKIAKQESKTVQKMESRLSLSGLEEK